MFNNSLMAVLVAILGTAFLAALYHHLRGTKARASQRGSYLDDCKTLFDGGLKAIKLDGYPRISGTYRGHTFDLQAVADTLNMRKLPTLWLLVTLPEPLPVKGTFDLMMRPRGIESFSKFAELPVQIITDARFPADCAIRTDNPQGLPPEDLIDRHLPLFRDDRAKELVIAPKGLRVVWLADEAHRGKYLIFRDAEMGQERFDPADLKPLLDYLIALREDVVATLGEPAP